MDAVFDRSGSLNSNVEVGKYTAVVISTGTYTDGVDVPSGANVGPIAGVAQESIMPNGFADYKAGQYQIVSGTAWPANAIPSSATGRKIRYIISGMSRVVAAGVIAAGDELNIADNQGRMKTVNEAGGTLVYIVGQAWDAATQAGDVIRAYIQLYRRKT
jgi:hypothetical protein